LINTIRFLPFLFFLFYAIAFSQSIDSLKTPHSLKSLNTAKAIQKDSLMMLDSLKIKSKLKHDTLVSIYQKPLEAQSYFIDRKEIDFMDYRYTGDLFKSFNLNYLNDYGSIGQPNETFLYGVGNNGISYFEDGIMQNNRLQNIFDLNNVQTEDIDSIEIVQLPRGFLYGTLTNPVSVNLISRDFIPAKPYTRIKFYQGPNGEAMIDGIFNEKVFNKFNVFFNFTNRKFDSSYANTSFSSWQLKLKIKYYLDNKINIQGTYGFENSTVGLNGGVNVDSLIRSNQDVNSTLYNGYLAPVNFNSSQQNYKFHYFNIRLLSNYFDNSTTDLNLYYKFDNTILSQSNDTLNYNSVNKDKIYGVSLKQDYRKDLLDFQINGIYEVSNLKYYSLADSTNNYYPVNYNDFSASAVISLHLLDSSLVPSIFYKFSNESGNNYSPESNGEYNGIGADIAYKSSDQVRFYLGYSSFKTGAESNFSQSFEAGMTSTIGSLFADLKLFKRKDLYLDNQYPFLNYINQIAPDLTGLGADINLMVWKFLLETQTSYYTSENSSELLYLFPKINFAGSVYYKNILFNNNLNLKTGLIYSFMGKRSSSIGEINSNWKLDLTAAGEIQKVAMVYFTWENLFDNTYYIVPYYPMFRRGIRFGISWELFN
jgi:hypothetical protein